MNQLQKLTDGTVVLCCGGKGCPKLKIDDNKRVSIKDDLGNEINISLEEAKLIDQALAQSDNS